MAHRLVAAEPPRQLVLLPGALPAAAVVRVHRRPHRHPRRDRQRDGTSHRPGDRRRGPPRRSVRRASGRDPLRRGQSGARARRRDLPLQRQARPGGVGSLALPALRRAGMGDASGGARRRRGERPVRPLRVRPPRHHLRRAGLRHRSGQVRRRPAQDHMRALPHLRRTEKPPRRVRRDPRRHRPPHVAPQASATPATPAGPADSTGRLRLRVRRRRRDRPGRPPVRSRRTGARRSARQPLAGPAPLLPFSGCAPARPHHHFGTSAGRSMPWPTTL